MSLINEALKKARQSQTGGPIADGPAFRPVEAQHGGDGHGGVWLPTLIGAVLLVSGVLVWQWYTTGAVTEVRARTTSVSVPAAPVIAPTPAPAKDNAVAAAATTPAVKVPNIKVSDPAAMPPAQDPGATNVVAVEPPKPPPPAFKLQGIFYRVGNPMAVINGKSVFVGSRVGDARVVSIEKDAATVVTATGETNLLELP